MRLEARGLHWGSRMMKMRILVVGVMCVLGAAACKKKEAGQPASGSATPGSSAVQGAKPASACSPTAWKEPGGLVCLEAPGFTSKTDTIDPESDDPEVRHYFTRPAVDDKPELRFRISWYSKRDASNAALLAANLESAYKSGKPEDRGEFAGGKGRYFVFSRADDEKKHQLYAVLEGKKYAYQCEADSYEVPIAAEVVAACKSLMATD